MKKAFIFILCFAMGGVLFAQSKSELKEQLDAMTIKVTELSSIVMELEKKVQQSNNERQQLQAKINTMADETDRLNNTIKTQNTALASYAEQVARLNSEITALSNLVASNDRKGADATATAGEREFVVFFSNTQNNTFTVPEGKSWLVSGFTLGWVYGKYKDARAYVRLTKWNTQKITNYPIGGTNGFETYQEAIPEKTTITVQVRTGGEDDNPVFAPDAEGYLLIKEIDNK